MHGIQKKVHRLTDSKKSTYPSLISIMYDVSGITSVGQIQ